MITPYAVAGDELLLGRAKSTISGALSLATPQMWIGTVRGGELAQAGPPFASPERKTQALTGALSQQWAVWIESESTELSVVPWRLYGFDRAAGSVRLLDSSDKLAGNTLPPDVPGYTGPKLLGRNVFYAKIRGGLRRPQVDIVTCELSDCKPAMAIRGAAFPTTDGRHIYAVQSKKFGSRIGVSEALIVQLRGDKTLSPVRTVPLEEGESFKGFAASRNSLVWCTEFVRGEGHFSRIFVMNRITREVRNFRSADDGSFGYPVATPQFVAWAESSGASPDMVGGYLYRWRENGLYKVGNWPGLYGIEADDKRLLYQTMAGDPADPESVLFRTGIVR